MLTAAIGNDAMKIRQHVERLKASHFVAGPGDIYETPRTNLRQSSASIRRYFLRSRTATINHPMIC